MDIIFFLIDTLVHYASLVHSFVWCTPYFYTSVYIILSLIAINIIYALSNRVGIEERLPFIVVVSAISIPLLSLWYYILCGILGLIVLFIMFIIVTLPTRILLLLSKYEIRKIRNGEKL